MLSATDNLYSLVFDETQLKSDTKNSQRIINDLLSTMFPEVKRTSEEPVVIAHDHIYKQIVAVSQVPFLDYSKDSQIFAERSTK